MAFFCPVCRQEFTEKQSLLGHLKNQHGNLWSCDQCNQSFNRYDNYEYHQKTCYFKTTGKRSAESMKTFTKLQKKDNVAFVGGALDDTIVQYRLNLQNEVQDDMFGLLKSSILKLKWKVNDEIEKKKVMEFYGSLYANFHLSSDTPFITEPPAVLNTETIEIYESSEINKILDQTYANLVSMISACWFWLGPE